MACFPFTIYVFFIALFIISVTILKTSTTLEVVGFNVLSIFAALFSIYIASDVLEYTMLPASKHKNIAYLFSAGAILMFVGILMTTIAYDKMVLEYAAEKREFKLDKSFRDLIEEIKDVSISTITLTIVSAIAIFYKWDELREVFNIIDPIVNTRLFSAWILRVILCIIIIILGLFKGISVLSMMRSATDTKSMNILGFKAFGIMFGFTMVYVGLPVFIILGLLEKNRSMHVVSSIILFLGTAIMHGIYSTDPAYEYARYDKPLIGMSYVLASLSILDAGSIYTPNALTALFKIGMPLATVGLSSYLVYLGNSFFQLSRQVQIQ